MDYLRRAFNQLLDQYILRPSPSNITPNHEPSDDEDHVTSIIRIALLLRTRLPADLVPMILDHAELWHPIVVATSLHPDRIAEPQSRKLQAALVIPPHLPRNSIRRIRLITVSRDQGWSSYPEDHDTYRGSYTWFEAGIRGLDPDNLADIETIYQNVPVDCQHRNALDPEHVDLCLAHEERYKYGAQRIATNIHAGKDFREHVVQWDLESEDEGTRRMIREVKGGCRIEVSAHAQFPGWVNYVKSVKIEVECAVVRKM
ncbi:hypothetical protein LTS08_001040 [Lithohypha guttulata]|nr:hypothetical protein LTS08_001040 [Lithohypha guttulata]